MTSLCAPLARKVKLVTAREGSGAKLCKEHLGVEATHALDPDETKTAFINRVAGKMRLVPFLVFPKCQEETRTKEDVKKRIEDSVYPSVTTWLRAFMDAEMTIVDSFHVVVFSILFNKPFWVIGTKSTAFLKKKKESKELLKIGLK